MSKRIEKLTIKDFRGATVPLELIFDKSKPIVMIFGESGTGESSIVDAFDFICNQKYGSIEDRSSINKKTHSPSIGKTKDDISVSLIFDGKQWSAQHKGNEPETEPAGFPLANILRRSNILKLIDAQPNKRYETLEQFLTVPNIEKCENTLRNAVRTQEREYNESCRALDQAKEELEKLQQELNESDKPTEIWAKEILEIDEEKLRKFIEDAEEIEKLQEKYTNAKEALDKIQQTLDVYVEKENQAIAELSEFQKRETSQEDLQKLLNRAKDYFTHNENIKICPVCEQSINASDILNRLIQRLSDMDDLTRLMSNVEEALKKKKDAEGVVKTREEDYKKCASDLVTKIKASKKEETLEDENKIDYDKLISELTAIDTKDIEKAREELEKYEKYKTFLKEQKDAAQKR